MAPSNGVPTIPVAPQGGAVVVRLETVGHAHGLAGVVWHYDDVQRPLGKAGVFEPRVLEVPLGSPGAIAGHYFLVQGEVLSVPGNRDKPYQVVVAVRQDDRELHRAVPPDTGTGAGVPANTPFAYRLQVTAGPGTAQPSFGTGQPTFGTMPTAPVGAPTVIARRARLRTVLWIHGMGDAEGGFVENLHPLLTRSAPVDREVLAIRHEEVLYEPLNREIAAKIRDVDFRAGAFLADNAQRLADLLKQGIVDLSGFKDATTSALGDVGGLVQSTGARRAVLTRIIDKLLAIVLAADGVVPRSGHTIDIVCHSLGTFVTYELLHHIARTDDGRALRPNDGVQIRNVFMLAPVLALIRDVRVFSLVPSDSELAIKRDPFEAPTVDDAFSGTPLRVGRRFWAYRHVADPFASIRVTNGPFLEEEPFTFKAFHAGPNMHAYTNYLEEFNVQMLQEVMK